MATNENENAETLYSKNKMTAFYHFKWVSGVIYYYLYYRNNKTFRRLAKECDHVSNRAPVGPNAMTATMETSCAWKTPVLILTFQVTKQYFCIFYIK